MNAGSVANKVIGPTSAGEVTETEGATEMVVGATDVTADPLSVAAGHLTSDVAIAAVGLVRKMMADRTKCKRADASFAKKKGTLKETAPI